MRSLAARLVLALVAATLVGLVLLDLAFIFQTEAQVTRARRTLQQALANDLSRAPATSSERHDLAETHGFIITLMSDVTAPRLALPPELPPGAFITSGPYEHFTDARRTVVVSRLRQEGIEAALGAQGKTLWILLTAGGVMVALGFFFLRRVVLAPLLRMTELLHKDDADALATLGGTSRDHLSQLSHAIIAQRQRISDQVTDLQHNNEALALAQSQLVRAERLAVVGQLAAGVAHEVGNPLAVLSGFVELLGDASLVGPERQQALARMTKELDRIHGTIRSLLDFSRVSKEGDEPGELGEVMTHVRALLAPQDKLRRIDVRWPTTTTTLSVSASSDALTQLLLNLLLNAADALNGTGVIEVGVAHTDTHITLTVEDSGPGIAPELRARVFEPFFTTKGAGQGTGLGLAVCESIVSRASGDIHVEASHLGGARFVITLPARKAPARSAYTEA